MIPVLYINLDRDTERRMRLEAELALHSIAGERFPATLWTALSDSEQTRYYSPSLNERQFHKSLVNGEKGCYASHLRAWQWLLDSPHLAVVVLEDDVRLTPAFAKVVEAVAALPPGWDMVKLLGRQATGKAEKLRRSQALVDGHVLVNYARVPSLTAGYVISRAGAAKLIQSRLPFGRPIDVDLRHFWENDLRIHGVEPAVIELDETSFESSIGAKPESRSLAARWRKFRHKAAYSARNWWYSHRIDDETPSL